MSLLNDTPERAYGDKLEGFNRFAAPELRALIAGLNVQPGDRVLDAGCGTGLLTRWLAEAAHNGATLGVDLAHAHIEHARALAPAHLPLTFAQGDISALPAQNPPFDLIFCSNTLHHLRDPIAALRHLLTLLRPGGRVALGRSSFQMDMVFAWDERLEGEVTRACYRYYRDKYGLDARDTANSRNYVGWARAGGGAEVRSRTMVIERIAPLSAADEAYLLETYFRGYWGQKVQPYLSAEDWAELCALTDPHSPRYALRRPDFHFLQSYTLVTLTRPT